MKIQINAAAVVPIGPETGYPAYLQGFGVEASVTLGTYCGFLMVPFIEGGDALRLARQLELLMDVENDITG